MSVIKKGTKLYSIANNKCPRCQQGDFWRFKNPYTNVFRSGDNQHTHCSHCNLKYERELGFWQGAMYVSYAIGVALFVAAWVATTVLLPEDASMGQQTFWIIAFILVMFPVNWVLSRIIWINLFVKYEGPDPAPKGAETKAKA